MAERDLSKKPKANPGRPRGTFPEQYREAVQAMYKDGKTVDDARDFLLINNYSVDKKVIARVMAGEPASLSDYATGDDARAHQGVGLASPFFDDELRNVVDGMILANRSANLIRAWLAVTGLDVEIDELVPYMSERMEALAELAKDPMALMLYQVDQGVLCLQSRRAQIWARMPDELKYSQKTHGDTQKEILATQRFKVELLNLTNEKTPEDVSAHSAEIERKLGIVNAEPVQVDS